MRWANTYLKIKNFLPDPNKLSFLDGKLIFYFIGTYLNCTIEINKLKQYFTKFKT